MIAYVDDSIPSPVKIGYLKANSMSSKEVVVSKRRAIDCENRFLRSAGSSLSNISLANAESIPKAPSVEVQTSSVNVYSISPYLSGVKVRYTMGRIEIDIILGACAINP